MICGNTTNVIKRSLNEGNTKSCGCLSTRKTKGNCLFKDLTGIRFGYLTVVERNGTDKAGHIYWLCKCDCGTLKNISSTHLKNNHTRSCGCYNLDSLRKNKRTHGCTINKSPIPEYTIWSSMKDRCNNSKVKNYHNYGGRGIKVCERWLDSKKGFSNFLEDMGLRPSKYHSLDRFPNNDGDYEKSNCRWATQKEQCSNTRTNRWVEYKGKRMILEDWKRYFNCKHLAALLNYNPVDIVFDRLSKGN